MMPRLLSLILGCLLSAGTAATAADPALPFDYQPGQLIADGMTLPSGAPAAIYPLQAQAGQVVVADMATLTMAPLIVLRSVDGTVIAEARKGDSRPFHARLEALIPADGEYEIVASMTDPAVTGSYLIRYTTIDGSGAESGYGRINLSDPLDRNQRPYHERQVPVSAGQHVVVTLCAGGFDSYVEAWPPGGRRERDDDGGPRNDSELRMAITQDGSMRVRLRGYRAAEGGTYWYTILPTLPVDVPPVSALGALEQRGQIGTNHPSTENFYTIAVGQGGEPVTILCNSTDFDGHIELFDLNGNEIANNDDFGSTRWSRIHQALVPGTYRLKVRWHSQSPGENGSYHLMVVGANSVTPEGQGAAPVAQPSPTTQPTGSAAARVVATPGLPERVINGALAAGDQTVDVTGEFADLHTVNTGPGEVVRLTLETSAFEPYLILITPDGQQIDRSGSPGTPLVLETTAAGGACQVVVTARNAGETGAYRLRVAISGGTPASIAPAAVPAGSPVGVNGF